MSTDKKDPAVVVELENGRFVAVFGNHAAEDVEVFLVNRQTDDPSDDLLGPYDFTSGEVEDRDSDATEVVDIARLDVQESPWGISALSKILDGDDAEASIDEEEIESSDD